MRLLKIFCGLGSSRKSECMESQFMHFSYSYVLNFYVPIEEFARLVKHTETPLWEDIIVSQFGG
jgi:hypothetical protein